MEDRIPASGRSSEEGREQRYRHEEAVLLELARHGESVYPDLDGVRDHHES